MTWTDDERRQRRYEVSGADQRHVFERDRDRILYSSAFHRLAGVTQIVRAGEQDVFHTRQQHTYKVAQVGRRLAQHCIRTAPEGMVELVGLDPEVVEAAALAHDLGHPPFGHAAEKVLDELAQAKGELDGFEGNAQTFRILTKLAVRFELEACPGLDLTRAVLAATLKYPWFRDHDDNKKKKKWSAYQSEKEDFEFAREYSRDEFKTAEAELMDWADDIAYSVHDLEDFHRVGVIPWSAILSDGNRNALVNQTVGAWFGAPADAAAQVRGAIDRLSSIFYTFPAVLNERYDGSREQRRQLRNLTSLLIGKYVRSAEIGKTDRGPAVTIGEKSQVEVRLLKQLARYYVIGLPALHAQQMGQRKIIETLFEIFHENGTKEKWDFFPVRIRYIWEGATESAARLACDSISILTENEAFKLHSRLTGSDCGSILDPIVR
jgi:dGTPase